MIIKLQNNKAAQEPVEISELQKEAIEMMKEYVPNLADKMTAMVQELKTELQEDTWEFLRMMIDGLNWVVQAYNGTSALLDAEGSIDKAEISKQMERFSEVYRNRDAEQTAAVLEESVVPFLRKLEALLKAQ